MTQGSSARSAEAEVYRRWYKSQQWQRMRLAQLAAHPLCRICAAAGRVTIATVADHITPHKGDRSVFMDPSNLQSLCDEAPWRCHSRAKQQEERKGFSTEVGVDGFPVDKHHPSFKPVRAPAQGPQRSGERLNASLHPKWLRAPLVPVTVVCGPPGSGKSTYVARQIADAKARGQVHRLICVDTIAMRMSQGSRRVLLNVAQLGDVLRRRNDMLADLSYPWALERFHAAWLIVSEPESAWRDWWAHKLNATIVVLETPEAECIKRIEADAADGDRRWSGAADAVRAWWAAYEPRQGDQIAS